MQTKANKSAITLLLAVLMVLSLFVGIAPTVSAAGTSPDVQNITAEDETDDGDVEEPVTLTASYISLAPGSDASKLNFSWHDAKTTGTPVVRIWKDGGEKAEFTGTRSSAVSTLSTMRYNRVTVTGLEANTTYNYRLGDGNDSWSATYTTKTQKSDSFSYIVFGDPQVSSQAYGNNWKTTLELALGVNPNAAFMASTGDNIDSNTTAQYNYFFTPQAIMTTLPLAVCMGNHEGSGTAPHAFYNPPNADGAQNYWYRYGDTLFMVWNCTTGNAAGMRAFLNNAIAANGDATWRILNFHYDVYGQGSSHALSDGKSYRDTYVQVIDDFDIDVVFNGHDHSYSRSFPMKWSGSAGTSNNQGMQAETFGPNGESIDPTGTVYFSLNSASGQKYYTLVAKQPYTAVMQQANRPHFSIVDMTSGSFTCTTYQVESNNSLTLIDTYTIVKTSGEVEPDPDPELIVVADSKTVRVGDYFEVEVMFDKEVCSNTAIITYTFDSAKFSYRGFTPADGISSLNTVIGDKSASITVMVDDYNTLNYGKALFSANDDAVLVNELVDIAVTVQYVLKDENGDKSIKTATGIDAVFTSGGSLSREYTLIDLSNIIDIFGIDSTDPQWNALYREFDFNGNGVIDIQDIVTLAQMIK